VAGVRWHRGQIAVALLSGRFGTTLFCGFSRHVVVTIGLYAALDLLLDSLGRKLYTPYQLRSVKCLNRRRSFPERLTC